MAESFKRVFTEFGLKGTDSISDDLSLVLYKHHIYIEYRNCKPGSSTVEKMGQDGMGMEIQPYIASVLSSFCIAIFGICCHHHATNNRITAVYRMRNDLKTSVPRQ